MRRRFTQRILRRVVRKRAFDVPDQRGGEQLLAGTNRLERDVAALEHRALRSLFEAVCSAIEEEAVHGIGDRTAVQRHPARRERLHAPHADDVANLSQILDLGL